MYRQPNYTPLDTPRAAPPADAVPVSMASAPTDARPVASTAYGDDETAQALKSSATLMATVPQQGAGPAAAQLVRQRALRAGPGVGGCAQKPAAERPARRPRREHPVPEPLRPVPQRRGVRVRDGRTVSGPPPARPGLAAGAAHHQRRAVLAHHAGAGQDAGLPALDDALGTLVAGRLRPQPQERPQAVRPGESIRSPRRSPTRRTPPTPSTA